MGYDDTPFIPGSRFRIHDANRPQPPVVRPGTASRPDSVGQPPSDAVVLFDGQDVSGWVGKDGGAINWKIEDGCMEVVTDRQITRRSLRMTNPTAPRVR